MIITLIDVNFRYINSVQKWKIRVRVLSRNGEFFVFTRLYHGIERGVNERQQQISSC